MEKSHGTYRAAAMVENPIKRIFRWILWVAGGVLLLLVGLHLLLPFLVNTHAVKSRILEMAGERIPGQLDTVSLSPRLLPLPHLMLADLRYHLPGKLILQIDSVDVYPQIAPLIGGRIQLKSMDVRSPQISIELPPRRSDQSASEKKSSPNKGLSFKGALDGFPSDWELHIADGRVILNRDGKAVADFKGVNLRAVETDDLLSIDIDGAEENAGRFELEAQLDRQTLYGKGEVALAGLQLDALEEILDENISQAIPRGKVDLSLAIENKGFSDWQASVVCSSPDLLVEKGGRRIRLEKIDLEGDARLTPQRLDVSLTRMRLAQPRADLSGKIVWNRLQEDESPPLRLSVQARESDVTRLRNDLLALFPDLQGWTLFEVIQGGTLASMEMSSSGASWEEIGRLQQLTISGRATDSRIIVPGAELDLTHVDGEIGRAHV